MRHVVSAAFIAIALAWGTGTQAQMPQDYPADYTKIIEAAKKEGKVVIYATTDAVAANPLIKDFETLYPGIKILYTSGYSESLTIGHDQLGAGIAFMQKPTSPAALARLTSC